MNASCLVCFRHRYCERVNRGEGALSGSPTAVRASASQTGDDGKIHDNHNHISGDDYWHSQFFLTDPPKLTREQE